MQINHKIKEKQIMDFLSLHDTSYDINQALVICQLYNFKVNFLFLPQPIGEVLILVSLSSLKAKILTKNSSWYIHA
jgi:hypothetical protein